jgi:ribosomal protein S18 acetylase RimI-like enzyme
MSPEAAIRSSPATDEERADLLALMREHLSDRLEQTMELMELSWSEFQELYRSRGQVRTIRHGRDVAGFYWLEDRGRELHLHAIFVLPEFRGRGVGSATMRQIEEEFSADADFIELGVRDDNAGARSLYKRQGFVVAETLPDVGFTIMRKHIGNEPSN